MWNSRTKTDLIIEVWEKLDCESVGAKEIQAVEVVVAETYGKHAVDSPMRIARLLADEGAELRHAEILELDFKRRSDSPYDAMFRHIVRFADLKQAIASIRDLENLRRKFLSDNDKDGLRIVRETAINARLELQSSADHQSPQSEVELAEIGEWLSIWLHSPEIFESWIALRQNSRDFREKFIHSNGSDPDDAV